MENWQKYINEEDRLLSEASIIANLKDIFVKTLGAV